MLATRAARRWQHRRANSRERRKGALPFCVMSAIAIRRTLVRRRGHLALLTAVFALAGAVAAHHGGVAVGDTPHGEHGADVSVAVETMCMAAFTVVGAAVAAIAIGLIALGRWRPSLMPAAEERMRVARPPVPRARAGPVFIRLCVLLR